MTRMFETPNIDVTIIESDEVPTGVGEPGVPPIAPAIANAIFNATGLRMTELPMKPNKIMDLIWKNKQK